MPQHTFIFLTKKPENLKQWSPLLENVWVGVTVDGTTLLNKMLYSRFDRIKASVKFISFEPLLADTTLDSCDLRDAEIGWVILGCRTQPIRYPPWAWVDPIVRACISAEIPLLSKSRCEVTIRPCISARNSQTNKERQNGK